VVNVRAEQAAASTLQRNSPNNQPVHADAEFGKVR